MMAAEPELTARWGDGRPVEPGDDALRFLAAAANRLGENPDNLLRLARSEAAAGRVMRKLLGLSRTALRSSSRVGRPEDRQRKELIVRLVRQFLEEGLSLKVACTRAAPLLADPSARARQGLGGSNLCILGNGPVRGRMNPNSVENAYRQALDDMVFWYFSVIDDEAADSQRTAEAEAGAPP